jgi:hypothetical protein
MHLGDAPARTIHGEANATEAISVRLERFLAIQVS